MTMTVREAFEKGTETFNAHDIDGFAEVLADDVVFRAPGGHTCPLGSGVRAAPHARAAGPRARAGAGGVGPRSGACGTAPFGGGGTGLPPPFELRTMERVPPRRQADPSLPDESGDEPW